MGHPGTLRAKNTLNGTLWNLENKEYLEWDTLEP